MGRRDGRPGRPSTPPFPNLRRPEEGSLGGGVDGAGLGLHTREGLGPEPVHRVALPLRGQGRPYLLERGERLRRGAFAAAQPLRLGGARHGRGRHPPWDLDGGGGDLRRLPRPVRDRVRDLEAPRLRPAAPDEAHQQGEAVPTPGRGAGRLPTPPAGPYPAHPLGHDRRAVRLDDQVRHRHPGRHGFDGSDPPAVHAHGRPPHPTRRCWSSGVRRRRSS
jgi:hypothetical protein